MNDNSVYVVSCTEHNFEDVTCVLKMFCRIVDIDAVGFCVRATSVDAPMMQRLQQMGVHFWPEAVSAHRTAAGGSRR